jgi:hypothetical protein
VYLGCLWSWCGELLFPAVHYRETSRSATMEDRSSRRMRTLRTLVTRTARTYARRIRG